MARYLFDIQDADGTGLDREGTGCVDARAVSALTTGILGEIAREEARLDGQTNLPLSVRGEAGRVAQP
jgi:predicted regulator of Ras-like GTPase activity (Roadblock/LC7/MglB family)